MLSRLLAVAASAALLVSLAACGSDSSDSSHSSGGSATQQQKSSTSSDWATLVKPTKISCSYPTEQDAPTGDRTVTKPQTTAQYAGKVPVTLKTSAGDVGLTLDADKAPCTVNSFLSLAQQDFFDRLYCHRLTTGGIYVLQCGDPTATSTDALQRAGAGGPGYTFKDELTGKEHYGAGVLAMANAGPNTNGSQFFLVYGDSSTLDQQPNYTIFGSIDAAGLKVIESIAAKGTDDANGNGDGHPNEPVRIDLVTAG